jgi:hypothetical protein
MEVGMNAQEARNLVNATKCDVNIQNYLNDIKQAAIKGESRIYRDGNIEGPAKAKLESLGYKVACDWDRNEAYYVISWE